MLNPRASPADSEPFRNLDYPYGILLDDSFPTADAPFELSPESFEWLGLDALPAGSKIEWVRQSVQWSRLKGRIVLPRATLRIVIPNADSVNVTAWNRVTPLSAENGAHRGEILVPLVSGDASQVTLQVRKSGSEKAYRINLTRRPPFASKVGIDSTCSPWGLELLPEGPSGAILIADCQIIRGNTDRGQSAILDIALFIDGAGNEIEIDGSKLRAEAPSLFRLRLGPHSESLNIRTASGNLVRLQYRVPNKLNRGFIGVGLGPYRYNLSAPGVDVSTTTPILTLYASYLLTDTVRFTAFNATALHRNYFTDTGFYLKSESLRILDQRATIYVMLGANLVGFKYGSSMKTKWGVPQGFEIAYRDFLSRNRTLILGAFIYPPIDGKSYYNTWIRYGSPGIFFEVNYLGIREMIENQPVSARSVGVSVGVPIARFF